MTARATYPIREAFHLDLNTKIESGDANAKDMGLDLGTIKTIRVIVLAATVVAPTGNGTAAKIEFKDADDSDAVFYTLTGTEIAAGRDANGVFLDHVRGKLWEGRRNVYYTYTAGSAGTGTAGTITGFSVYLDSVEVNY
jgi:hypothetical protein